jgi:hypothetical protein
MKKIITAIFLLSLIGNSPAQKSVGGRPLVSRDPIINKPMIISEKLDSTWMYETKVVKPDELQRIVNDQYDGMIRLERRIESLEETVAKLEDKVAKLGG